MGSTNRTQTEGKRQCLFQPKQTIWTKSTIQCPISYFPFYSTLNVPPETPVIFPMTAVVDENTEPTITLIYVCMFVHLRANCGSKPQLVVGEASVNHNFFPLTLYCVSLTATWPWLWQRTMTMWDWSRVCVSVRHTVPLLLFFQQFYDKLWDSWS